MSSWIIIDGTIPRAFPGSKLGFSWLEAVNTIKRFHFLLPGFELCQTKGARFVESCEPAGHVLGLKSATTTKNVLLTTAATSQKRILNIFHRQSVLEPWSRPPSVPCKQTSSRFQLSDSLIKRVRVVVSVSLRLPQSSRRKKRLFSFNLFLKVAHINLNAPWIAFFDESATCMLVASSSFNFSRVRW